MQSYNFWGKVKGLCSGKSMDVHGQTKVNPRNIGRTYFIASDNGIDKLKARANDQ
jgi:hypothetical protein